LRELRGHREKRRESEAVSDIKMTPSFGDLTRGMMHFF
jgi:hypothetical protein